MSQVKLYADDIIILYSSINSITDCYTSQDLDKLQWADRWQMTFNYSKHEVTKRKNPVFYTYKMKDHIAYMKYLVQNIQVCSSTVGLHGLNM